MGSTTDLAEAVFPIQQNPAVRPGLAALLSLLIPGLGQAYLGQYFKAFSVFTGSLLLCFGLGLCNVLAALDARAVAHRIQVRGVNRGYTSMWLAVPAWVLRKIRKALTPRRDAFLR